MRRIATLEDIAEGLEALCKADARLLGVREAAGSIPLRLHPPGFASLAAVVVSQQVSTASAAAIHARFSALFHPLTPQALLSADDEAFRQAGLSRPKQKALIAIARAIEDGLNLESVVDLDGEAAMAALTSVSGIGPWTAEVYLLTAAGHPDVFPSKDVALQAAVHHALNLESRPGDKALAAMAESWSPWRAVAARLFWAYYRSIKGRDGLMTAPAPQQN
ncbi:MULTISPECIES: DNA-3-methyladenine glycosylase family protein [Mesorhizobium]|uniref:DNA-3-methyladenine glycosylase II n=1 Tax=Mesorhizobium denitrificans TaxID=2294114 RepID=A0A371XFD5_9HYPH|nr:MULTISPECIES: DNA-3-methyladenine glycosylase [Mesorhizobium]RFC67939.1 DNA-3-methyladenine glycosylase 2 family protein [Mesorhizobium denitrificans]